MTEDRGTESRGTESRGPDVAGVERWMLGRGLPHFIDGYSASRDVFTRALPVGTLILVAELVGTLNSQWAWWANLLVVSASFGALVAVWGVANRARGRPWRARAERVGTTELAVFTLMPALLPLAAGGQWRTAVSTFAANLILLGLIYVVTSYGLVPMTRWAAGRLQKLIGDLFGLMVRALPMLLLFVVFLFWASESWQVAASLDGPFMAIVVGLFVALGVAFVVSRIPREVGALARFDSWDEVVSLVAATPAAGLAAAMAPPVAPTPPLSRRQWGNIGLVVLFSQGLQVAFTSLIIGTFLVALGLAAVTPETARAWTGGDLHVLLRGTLWGRPVALTAELLQVSGLLASVAGFSFTLSLLTDSAYRKEFLEDVLGEVREAFAVRAVYLAALGRAGG